MLWHIDANPSQLPINNHLLIYQKAPMNNQIIFQENGISLVIGDKLILVEPLDNELFYQSAHGKPFKEGKCNVAFLEVKQHPWREVYFELTYFFNNTPLSYWDMEKQKPNESIDVLALDPLNSYDKTRKLFLMSPFQEGKNYSFLREYIHQGAYKMLPEMLVKSIKTAHPENGRVVIADYDEKIY